MSEAWPHQRQAVRDVQDAIARGEQTIVLTSPTGGGKTRIACDLIEQWCEEGLRTVVYTNRRLLVEQLEKVLNAAGIEHGVRAAGHETNHDRNVQIASVPTENARTLKGKTWQVHPADRVVIDECVTGETLIATPTGNVRIDNVRAGDRVYCAAGVGTVEAVSARPTKTLYRLEFSNGSTLDCTGNHPIFTAAGWLPARTLVDGTITFSREDVSDLWAAVPTPPLVREGERTRHRRESLDSPEYLLAILLKEIQEPNGQCGVPSENAFDPEEDRPQTYQTRRQRAIAALAPSGAAARSGGTVGTGVPDPDRDVQTVRVPQQLQSGLGQPREEAGHRTRRVKPWRSRTAAPRLQENDAVGYSWLVRVSRIQRTRSVPVFNLRVSGHPSYFANGWLVHNCHLQTGKAIQALALCHVKAEAVVLGLTATPLDLGGMYGCLIQAGTNSELRECGALVWCRMFGCDEPDLSKIGRVELGADLTEKQNVAAIMRPGIFARVLEWYKKLNSEQKPSILFAPDVAGSLFFAEEFVKAGISAAHIDGQEVWINGKVYKTSPAARADALAGSRDGRIAVLCNRFVLREGIDAPWLAHGIFATVFGSLQSYLQSGGRLLRSHPGLQHVTLQDHGGNWWRHGSLNADRTWRLGDTATIVSGLRENRLRDHTEREPARCPRCGLILGGSKCPCGFVIEQRSRIVVQSDGSLKEMTGDVYKPRPISKAKNGIELWKRIYWRSQVLEKTRKDGTPYTTGEDRTFQSAMALFAKENEWKWPDPTWPLMPKNELDVFRLVKDVAREDLT